MNPLLAAENQSNPLGMFLPMILIAAAFYFFLIRPQKKRQQEQAKMQKSLDAGTQVLLTSGIYGTVLDSDGGDILVEIAEGVHVRALAGAVMRVVEPTEFEETDEHASDELAAGEPVSDEPVDKADGEKVELTKDLEDAGDKKA